MQRQVLNRDLAQARFVRLQMGRQARLRPELGAFVRHLDSLDVLILITQVLPDEGALQGDRRQCAARLSLQSPGALQGPWPYQSAPASQVGREVIVQG